jgi:hypothetical protein
MRDLRLLLSDAELPVMPKLPNIAENNNAPLMSTDDTDFALICQEIL